MWSFSLHMKKIKLPSGPKGSQTASPAKGLALILVGTLLFSAMALATRYARGHFRADTLVFYRMIIQTLAVLPFVWPQLRALSIGEWGAKFRLHSLRAAAGTLSMLFLYHALALIPIGLVTLLGLSSVLWASGFSFYFLGDRPRRGEMRWGGLACLGLVVSFLPTGDLTHWQLNVEGLLAALAYGLFMGVAMAAIKGLRRTHGSNEIVFFFGLLGIFFMLPFWFVWPEYPVNFTQTAEVFLIGALGATAQIFMTAGFRYTSAFLGTAANLQQAVVNTLLGFLLLSEIPPPHFLFGLVIVLVGMIGIFRTQRPSRQ
jgi:drug/metabolite transporter (DMT)-like permease